MLLNQLLLDMWLNTAYTPHEIYSCRLFKYFHRSTTISYPSRKLEICGSPSPRSIRNEMKDSPVPATNKTQS